MTRCVCGYYPGENFSGNCAKCISLISERGAKKRGGNKSFATADQGVSVPPKKQKAKVASPTVAAGASAVDATPMPSRLVGKAALSVFNRAQAAAAIGNPPLAPLPTAKAPISKAAAPNSTTKAPISKAAGIPAASTGDCLSLSSDGDNFSKPPTFKKKSKPYVRASPTVFSNEQFPSGFRPGVFGVGAEGSSCYVVEAPKPPQDAIQNTEVAVTPLGSQSEGEGDAEMYDMHNLSAVETAQRHAAQPVEGDVHMDLGDANAQNMSFWWDIFLDSKRGGGFLARSLFAAAAQDTVLGHQKWNGITSIASQKKQVLAEMRVKWLEWTECATIHEWVRAKLFHIIISNPKTYSKFKVQVQFFTKS